MTTSVKFEVLMRPKIKFPSDFVAFNEKILYRKHYLCSVYRNIKEIGIPFSVTINYQNSFVTILLERVSIDISASLSPIIDITSMVLPGRRE